MSRYHLIKDKSEIDKVISSCKATGYCCFDFETNAEKLYSAEFTPTLLSISFQPGSGIAIPLNHFESPNWFRNHFKRVIQKIGRALIEDPNIVKIGWNWKFDNQIMMLYDVYHKGVALDGMLAKYILDEERPMDLKSMTDRYLPEYSGYEAYEGSKLPWDKKPLEPLAKYGCMDTDMTFRLMMFFEKKLIDNGFYSLYRNLIMMASRALQDTERNGMRLDIPFNQELRAKYEKAITDKQEELRNIKQVRKFDKATRKERIDEFIDTLEQEIESFRGDPKKARQIRDREDKIARIIAGEPKTKAEVALFEPVNFGSQKQMVDLLFTHPKGFKLPVLSYTKKDKKDTTNPSTAEDALIELKNHDKSGFIDHLLDLRGLQTINSTFVLGIGDKVCPDERIHPLFNIHGCVTEDTILIGKHSDIVIGDIAPHVMGVMDISSRGLEVLTHDGTFQLITHSVNKGYQETWEIETNKGDKLKCTPEHKLYTIQGMKKVRDIIDCNIPIITYDTKYLNVTPKKVYPPATEVLQEIPNWPGYMVSNMGNVYSTKTKGSQGKAFCEPRKMCIRPNKRGSTRVGLRDNKGYKTMLFVSRLMWETFRGPIPYDYIIDHIDCNPTHNWLNNLQCITKSENIKRAYLNTRNAFSKGSKNGSSKFTTLNIGNILFDISNGVATKDISSKYNISPKQLCRIIKGEAWSHISIDHIKVNKKWPSKLIVDLTVANNHSYVTRSNFINSNTVTGRLSSKDPNFQNLPRPTTNPDIKKMMIPAEGCLFLEMDYSQAELRVLAHLAKEKTMLEWFRTGKDIHLASACKKYHVEYDDIIKIYSDEQHPEYKTWKIRRKQAKCYSGDTEILTPKGWQRLDSYDGTSEVAQYNFDTEEINFTPIENYGKVISENNYTYSDRNVELDITDEHKTLFITRAKKKVKADFKDLVGKNGYMPCAGFREHDYPTPHSITRFIAMFIADGNLNGAGKIRFGFTRTRKISRCKEIMDGLGLTYTNPRKGKFYLPLVSNNLVVYQAINELVNKGKQLSWSSLDKLDPSVFLDEASNWDSHKDTRWSTDSVQFSTTVEQTADVMQAMGTLCGIRVVKHSNTYHGKTKHILSYKLKVSPYSRVNLTNAKPYHVKGGKDMWSVTVPFRNLVTRKNNKVVLSGNTINFGIAYEQTAMKLSESLSTPEHKVSVEEAQVFLDEFFRDFPNIKKFIKKQHKFAEKHGWVKTMFGRKRRLPNVYSSNYREYLEALRFSSNAPIQGTASDFALFSSVLMWEEVRKGNFPIFRQCTTVHDSLVFEIKASDITGWLVNSMWNICKNPGTKKYFGFQITDVNMDMDFSVGRNYAEELPFKVGFDYTRMLEPDFDPKELHDFKEPCNYREYSSNIK